MSRTILIALLACASGAALPALAAPTVKITGAWCRAAPPTAPAGGCYLTLTAPAADRLVAVRTPAAEHAEIHTMSMDGDVMRMGPLPNGIALPAGTAVALKPGGEHVMLIAPKQPLRAGGTVQLTLTFAKAPPVTLKVPVQAAPMGGQ